MATTVHPTVLAAINAAASQAGAQQAVNDINSGAGNATAVIYDGTKPADPTVAPGATALATVTYSPTAFADPVGGVATANAITGDSSATAGVAAWGRLFDGDGAARMDFDVVDVPTSDGMQLDDLNITAGAQVDVTAHTITVAVS